ncbi:TNT domain-containing protein [Gordonia crocea]|uniref:TNT domain-containing protein n=1 Tax=Gordonia crocea TaxID=589162 RepID=UPI001E580876|nr:TNT domain-containing protein [Gordonia crocea]
MSPPVAVRPTQFTTAANAFEQLQGDIRRALDRLVLTLGSSDTMAGQDAAGRSFSSAYDKTVNGDDSLLAGIALMGNACGRMAELLDASAVNHANANQHYALCTPTNPSGEAKNLESIPVVNLGSTFGGPGEPSNWEKLKEFIQGEVFPDGDPGKLQAAGDAWTAAATSLRQHHGDVATAIAHIANEQSVEVTPAQDQAAFIQTHLSGIAGSCDSAAKMCNDFGSHVKETRDNIADEVKQLMCELVGGAVIGALLTLVTAGLSNVLSTAAGIARATRVGAKIARMIKALTRVTGGLMQRASYILDPVGAAAGDLGALMGSRATVFGMNLSKGAVRANSLANALKRLPDWAHGELQRAVDPALLRSELEAQGVPKHIIDEAIASNPYRNMTPEQIVDKYWKDGSWKWPENNGFKDGQYTTSDTLPPDLKLDRIGSENGSFLATEGTPYSQRALAPGTANEYHTYQTGPNPLPDGWKVQHGEVAGAFGQNGGGTQWVVVNEAGEHVPVAELLRRGILK